MKRTLLSVLLLAIGTSCSNSQNKSGHSIKGTIRGLNGGYAYLEELTFTGRYAIDTAQIDAGGSFSFRPQIRHKGLYQIKFNQQAALLLALDEKPFSITIEGDTASLRSFTFRLSGSAPSEQLRRLIAEQKKLSDALNEAIRVYQSSAASNSGDMATLEHNVTRADSSLRQFIKQHVDTVSHPVVALFAVSNLDPDRERATFEQLEQKLKTNPQPSPLEQSFLTMMADQRTAQQGDPYAPKFKVGDVVPDIEMADVNGNMLKLSSLRGKVVLLDFWASWCGPCRMENPNIVRAYEQYKAKGFTVFSVSLDMDRNRWITAIEKDKLTWPYHVSQLKGWQSPICQEYNIRSIPASYLLDREGRVVAVNPRGSALEAALSKMLN
ncbi:MAG: TlpA disulfide reductase family protein [Chitinophagales bacterium]|nr:AhpC/TSA family protein [Chitinophagales bacterium]MDW8392984.1 TlpA disulfide reductase family protein [Chitinophagales bacterium]